MPRPTEQELDVTPLEDGTVIGFREHDENKVLLPIFADELDPYWLTVLKEGHAEREKKHL